MSILTFLAENYHVIGSSTALTLLLTKLLDKYIRKGILVDGIIPVTYTTVKPE